MFFRSNNKSRFEVALCHVDQCEDKMQQARLTAEDVLANALGMRNLNICAPELQGKLQDLINKFPKEMLDSTSPYTNYEHIDLAFSKGDYPALVYMNQRTKFSLLDLERKVTSYQHAIEHALYLEEV